MPKPMTPDRLKAVCLLDAIGAASSTIGLVGLSFVPRAWVGVPGEIFLAFAVVAALFVAHSAFCYRAKPSPTGRMVARIGALNLAYCTASLAVLSSFRSNLQPLGIAYVVLELAVVVPLALYEIHIGRSSLEAP